MTVFLVYFALLFALWSLNFANRHHNYPVKRLELFTAVFLGVCLFLIAALRSSSVGADVKEYVNFFNLMKRFNWAEIFKMYREFGYFEMNKLILLFTDNAQALLAVVGAVYAAGATWFIRKYSKDACMSFFLLMTMSFFYFSLCVLRQSIAMAVLLFSTPFIRRRKFPQFLAVVLVAATFHTSALIFILAYFAAHAQITERYLFLVAAGLAGTLVLSPLFVRILQALYPSYAGRATGTNGLTLLLEAVIVAVFVLFRKDMLARDPLNKIYFNLAFLALFFEVISLTLDVVFRIAMYFSIFFLLSVPELLQSIRDRRLAVLGYMGIVALMAVVYFGFTYDNAGVYPYEFFWQ